MITIKNAWVKQGYSGEDHLNDNQTPSSFIGRQFRSVGEARETIWRAAVKSGSNFTRSPIGMEVMFADGTTRKV
jgi:hypothetical protein